MFHRLLPVRLMSPIGEMLPLGGGFSLQLPEEIGDRRLMRISRYNVLSEESDCDPITPAIVVRPAALNPKPDEQ
jgi:hypothetical protein